MRIVNTPHEDFHVHSLNYSDGMETIDGIVKYAGQIGMTRIAITDHCQATLDHHRIARKGFREIIDRWKNVHNLMGVIFGIEADLLNEQGDICDQIQGVPSDWLILSAHKVTYYGNPQKVTEGYLRAMEKFGSKIRLIGHPCSARDFASEVDLPKVVEAANERGIPLEVNGKNLMCRHTDLSQLDLMLKSAREVMVNSDAHTLYELTRGRAFALEFLKEKGYLK